MRRKYVIFAVVTLAMVALDQLSKLLVMKYIAFHTQEVKLIPGFLSFIHTRNTGAAFSMMAGFHHRMWVFGIFTVVALIVLGHMLVQLPADDILQTTAVALITSGALGNAIDRIARQSVTDFIRVYTDSPRLRPWLVAHFGTAEWPTFNVADTAIVVGIGLFFVHWLLVRDTEDEPDEDDDEAAPSPPLKDAEQHG